MPKISLRHSLAALMLIPSLVYSDLSYAISASSSSHSTFPVPSSATGPWDDDLHYSKFCRALVMVQDVSRAGFAQRYFITTAVVGKTQASLQGLNTDDYRAIKSLAMAQVKRQGAPDDSCPNGAMVEDSYPGDDAPRIIITGGIILNRKFGNGQLWTRGPEAIRW